MNPIERAENWLNQSYPDRCNHTYEAGNAIKDLIAENERLRDGLSKIYHSSTGPWIRKVAGEILGEST